MGFFTTTKSLPKEDFVTFLTDMAIASIQTSHLEPYKMILRQSEGNDSIDERQKIEILIFEMLALTRTIFIVIEGDLAEEISDKFHTNIYGRVSIFNLEEEEFQQLIKKRYQKYQGILSAQDENMMISLGNEFTKNFFNKEEIGGKELVFFITSAEMFLSSIKNYKEFLNMMFSKYKLI